MTKEVIKTVAVRNTTGKLYNGYKPGQIINVTKPERYLLEGWTLVGEKAEADETASKEKTKAELVAEARELGIDTKGMNKEQIATAIEEKKAEADETGDATDPDLVNALD